MRAEHPSPEEFLKILAEEIDHVGTYFHALSTVGYCARHKDAEYESELASELTNKLLRGKIFRLSEEGKVLVRQHPEYETYLTRLSESADRFLQVLNIPAWEREEKIFAAIAAYHHQQTRISDP